MISKKYFFFLFLIVLPVFANAQEYFQQNVRYVIHVSLDDMNHELTGTDTIVYTNNSSDSLNEIWIQVWPNAYKNNTSALAKQLLHEGKTFFYYSDDSLKGYINNLDFRINGDIVKWAFDSVNNDICRLLLADPLKTGDSVKISTPFHIKLPDSRISRMGHEGQSYQISQWFPKPAVYDKNGWNAFPYLDQGEFYSEFGTFDVYITLPANYVVGATGDLVNGEEELKFLKQKDKETRSIHKFSDALDFPLSSSEFKTLHYHQSDVHDFAWFADKRYHVLKDEVELPVSKRKVNTWVMFTNHDANLWRNSIEYVKDAVFYYSKWVGEYPYNNVTAVQGALSAGGGMEYPNITVISSGGDSLSLEMVIMHEVGHNWFYGILGSNERNFPWMDEGINSFYEYRYLQTKYPGSTLYIGKLSKLIHTPENLPLAERALLYQVLSHINNDQPAGLPSEAYSITNYSGIVYEKTAVIFEYLFRYLGESKFDDAIQQYFAEWKFRHPQPDDLQKIMENSTGEKLEWLFGDMIKTNKKLDYKLKSFRKNIVTIKNKGQIIAPFSITLDKKEIWSPGFEGKQKITFNDISPTVKTSAKINSKTEFLEFNFKNNFARNHSILKKLKPLKIQMLPGIDDPDLIQQCITPLFGYNAYNGFMPGLAFYNNPLPQKKFSYFLLPLYGTKNNAMNGIAQAGFMILPESGIIQYAYTSLNSSKFTYGIDSISLNYLKIAPQINIKFKNRDFNSSSSKELSFRSVNIFKDELEFPKPGVDSALKINSPYYVNELLFSLVNKRKINPYSIKIKAEQGNRFLKSSIDLSYRISYNKVRKGFDVRFFAGAFLISDLPIHEDLRFRLSGEKGYQDYLYDHYYFGRTDNNTLFSHQFSETDGGFKIFTPLGQTWKWLAAMNFKTSIPGKVPIKLYADIGTYEGAGSSSISKRIAYNAGIELSIINDIFEIYFPLAMSEDIKKVNDLNGVTYWENIRFKLSIEKADPFKALRSIR